MNGNQNKRQPADESRGHTHADTILFDASGRQLGVNSQEEVDAGHQVSMLGADLRAAIEVAARRGVLATKIAVLTAALEVYIEMLIGEGLEPARIYLEARDRNRAQLAAEVEEVRAYVRARAGQS